MSANAEIAEQLIRLIHNQRNRGFGLCFLYLRNVKGHQWNHQRVYRIYREWALNLRIKPNNREGLAIEVDQSLPAARVVRALEQVIEWRGKPASIRCDNGPEYLSATLLNWAEKQQISIQPLQHIQPGKPQQNAYAERYNRTVRYDWLNQHLFDSVEQVLEYATRWLWSYNHERPNMALGGITPKLKLAQAA